MTYFNQKHLIRFTKISAAGLVVGLTLVSLFNNCSDGTFKIRTDYKATDSVSSTAGSGSVGLNNSNSSSNPTSTGLATASAPTITNIQVGDGSFTVIFSPPASDGGTAISSYIVNIKTIGTSGILVASASGDTSPITVTGLTNGTWYDVYLAAVTANGNGEFAIGYTRTPSKPVQFDAANFSCNVNQTNSSACPGSIQLSRSSTLIFTGSGGSGGYTSYVDHLSGAIRDYGTITSSPTSTSPYRWTYSPPATWSSDTIVLEDGNHVRVKVSIQITN